MLIAPGIHHIPGTIGARPLYLYLLHGETRTVLLDTGTANDPEQFIIPYLEHIGLDFTTIDIVINTHADADHVGGNAALKRANPHLAITCGEADRYLIQDPSAMIAERYGAYRAQHDIGPDDAAFKWYTEMLGEPQTVDWTWSGGESLRLGPDWFVHILATPGHSAGHLTIFDPRSRTALMGDAIHGGIGSDALGNPTFPAYTDVEPYLSSIESLRRLDVETLAGCHWQVMQGLEVDKFLTASSAYVEMLDNALCSELASRREGATLRELIRVIGPILSQGRPVSDLELAFTFAANMEKLAKRRTVVQDAQELVVRYRLAGT